MKTLSQYMGWELTTMATNLQNFAIYQDYCKGLPSDYVNAKHRKYWVEITANQVIRNFDNNKRELAGTQYVWTKRGFPHQICKYCTAETHTINPKLLPIKDQAKYKDANGKLKEWEVCPCNQCDLL